MQSRKNTQALATTGASAFSDLPNWITNGTCKTIKAFGNYLMALNLTEGGTNLPNKVRWGDTAEDFSYPSTWTAAATNDAGAVTIGDEADEIIDGLALKESFIIYKGNSTWIANYIGGMVADKFGDEKALFLGIILSALGCYLIQYCDSTIEIVIAVGLLSAGGAGIAGLAVAMSAVNKKVPEKKAGLAFGVLNAGGSLGQTFLAPIGVIIIINYGWIFALNCLSLLLLLTLPLTYFLRDHRVINKSSFDEKKINILGMIKLAFQTPSYNFLALGFFTCGFHVAFISTHMPGVIAYCGLPTSLSGWSLAFIGLFLSLIHI